jgi:hypothetical protein
MKPLVAHLSSGDRATNQRGTVRRALKLQVPSADEDSGTRVLIHNISEGGMLIETSARLSVGDALQVHLPHAGSTDARVVRSDRHFFGCRFTVRISTAAVSAALLRAPAGQGRESEQSLALSPSPTPEWAALEEDGTRAVNDRESIVAMIAVVFLSFAVLFFLYAVLELQIAM